MRVREKEKKKQKKTTCTLIMRRVAGVIITHNPVPRNMNFLEYPACLDDCLLLLLGSIARFSALSQERHCLHNTEPSSGHSDPHP